MRTSYRLLKSDAEICMLHSRTVQDMLQSFPVVLFCHLKGENSFHFRVKTLQTQFSHIECEIVEFIVHKHQSNIYCMLWNPGSIFKHEMTVILWNPCGPLSLVLVLFFFFRTLSHRWCLCFPFGPYRDSVVFVCMNVILKVASKSFF